MKEPDTHECKNKNYDIFDNTGHYVKSFCIVPRGNKYETARKYCWDHEMSLFKPASGLAYLLEYLNKRYPDRNGKGFFFIDSGAEVHPKQCKIVHRMKQKLIIDSTSCKNSGWFICEYELKGIYNEHIYYVVIKLSNGFWLLIYIR